MSQSTTFLKPVGDSERKEVGGIVAQSLNQIRVVPTAADTSNVGSTSFGGNNPFNNDGQSSHTITMKIDSKDPTYGKVHMRKVSAVVSRFAKSGRRSPQERERLLRRSYSSFGNRSDFRASQTKLYT